MAYYTCEADAIAAVTDLKARKVLIKEIISQLYATMTKAAGKADTEEYHLNDGQTVIKAIRRNPAQILETINALNAQVKWIDNELCGRIAYLRNGINRG